MDKYYKWKVIGVVLLIAFSVWKAFPIQEKINLGLDLQGGMQLLLEVEMDKVSKEDREDVTDRVAEIIRNRIDEFGVREPVISTQGVDQVIVRLPGLTDRKRAIEIVGKTAHLEFRLVSNDGELIEQAEAGNIPEGYDYKPLKGSPSKELILVGKKAALTGEHLTTATVGFDQYGSAIVQLTFDQDGAKIFDKVTFQNIGSRLAIVLDGQIHSAPVIRDRIPSGDAQITGSFTADQASDLALVLRAGALPAPVRIIEERTVGPSLGRDSIKKGVRAGLLGLVLVVLFMAGYYLLCGAIAIAGLFIYILFVVGALAAFSATLTLPGIGGFILAIGMAVDANVLIFERIREEFKTGKGARAAVSSGYHKAFSAIWDANITTLITSLILFAFGTGPVQGFAATLSIGIVASMFTALVVTRLIFDFLTRRNANLNLRMFEFIKTPHIPFLKGRFWAYGFSVVALSVGIMAFAFRGTGNFGVEFTGGTFVQIAFSEQVDISDFRAALDEVEAKSYALQSFGSQKDNQFVVKVAGDNTQPIESAAMQLGTPFQILKVDQVGPSVSNLLRKKALWAVAWACLGILIYIGWRFEFKFAMAAVIALLHDVIFTSGIYAMSGREINLPIIAAILTILGYSVNDTIVTFDRVRDNLKSMRRKPFAEIVSTSINQTLSRTILTTITTLLAAGSLFLFGGSGINDFAFTLLVGFTVGIYSTIFVATALVVDWKAH